MTQKKQASGISRLMQFAGTRKYLVVLSCALSAVSTFFSLCPFIWLWFAAREIFMVLPDLGQVSTSALLRYAWFAVAFAAGGFLLYFVSLLCSHLAAFCIAKNMKMAVLKHLTTLPLGFFGMQGSGKIRKVIDENADSTETFIAHQLPDLAGAFVTPFIIFSVLFIFDWRLGLLSLIPLALGFAVQGTVMGTTAPKYIKQVQDAGETMNREAVEYVRGIPVVKVFQQTIYSFKSFYRSILSYKENITAFALVCQWPMSIFYTLVNASFLLLIPFGLLFLSGTADYRGFLINWLFYILFTPACAGMINKIMYVSSYKITAEEAVRRIDTLLEEKPLVKTKHPSVSDGNTVTFSHVTFTYPGAPAPALRDLSFELPSGKTYALVGASGSGKTTAASLIPRFYDVDKGSIKIGGVDVRDITDEALSEKTAFVLQTTKLFKTSILENVRMSCPAATEDEVLAALHQARCDDIIHKFPQGIHTVIGTEGIYLSGGEVQRLALARAILKNAPIIILDEATSFADAENEYQIQKAFEHLMCGKTVLMIAHRLTTVQNADFIFVMADGKIVETGTHEELLKMDGIYANMWREYQRSAAWNLGNAARVSPDAAASAASRGKEAMVHA